ncbi:hypothetical protein OC835_001307 [Tilletia horrida]|nr:hypothetical protein OC835_001307 [Tilletia horrida]
MPAEAEAPTDQNTPQASISANAIHNAIPGSNSNASPGPSRAFAPGSSSASRSAMRPTMSNAARNALHGTPKPAMQTWTYHGVYRWTDGCVDENALSGADVIAETQRAAGLKKTARDAREQQDAGAGGAGAGGGGGGGGASRIPGRGARYAHLRERWVCNVCSSIRHEQIGATSNLTKHARECGKRQKQEEAEAAAAAGRAS